MKKINRIILWFVLNSLVVWLVYAVVFTSLSANSGLVQLTKFLLWTNSIICWLLVPVLFLAAVVAKPTDKHKQKEPVQRSVPAWLSHLVDMAVVLGCAYAGWIWTAGFYFSHVFAQGILFSCLEMIHEKQTGKS